MKATTAVKPAFPDVSLKKEVTGVVVAGIEIDEKGDVESVTILQSPSKEIGSAVKKALERWRFSPTTIKRKPVRVTGKLTFYYEIENGVGLVLSPQEKRAFPYQTESSPHSVRMGEGVLRMKATTVVRPAFPDVSLKKEVTGVVVAGIEIDEKGDVESVTILQSPSKEIGSAVKKALERWRFSPTTIKRKPVRVTGKLTFYYEIENGVGLVLSPQEKRAFRPRRPLIVKLDDTFYGRHHNA